MKKVLATLLFLLPLIAFTQGLQKNTIDWLSLDKAIEYSEKYNKQILIYFYKKNCEFCDKMTNQTLNQIEVVTLINNNFFPVKINSRTKDTIYYKSKAYGNQQPIEHGSTWRHDFYFEVASFTRNEKPQSTTPTIVLFNNQFEKIKSFPGYQPKQQLVRGLSKYKN